MEAAGIPIADAFAQDRQAGGLGVLCAAIAYGFFCGLTHQGRRREVWLADVQEDHR